MKQKSYIIQKADNISGTQLGQTEKETFIEGNPQNKLDNSNILHLLCPYDKPGSILTILCALPCLILLITIGYSWCIYPHLIDEETQTG